MHIHHFTLSHVARKFREEMPGATLVEAFTQDKDEAVFGFATADRQLYLRVSCVPNFPFVWPLEDYARAKRNVLDLFQELIGKDLRNVRTVAWDRCLILEFEAGLDLVLKMYGLRSNILMRRNSKVEFLFCAKFETDREYVETPGTFAEDWESFDFPEDEPVAKRLKRISRVLDAKFEEGLRLRMEKGLDFRSALNAVLKEARNNDFFVYREKGKIRFSLLDPGREETLMFHGISEGLGAFVRTHYRMTQYEAQYRKSEKALDKHLQKVRGQVSSCYATLSSIESARSAEEIGHILMANLHVLKPGMKSVELEDYYTGGKILVKLKEHLSPAENAEAYYQKHKKRRGAAAHAESMLKELEPKLQVLESAMAEFRLIPAPETLPLDASRTAFRVPGEFAAAHTNLLATGDADRKERKHPFREFSFQGYTVLVGRSSTQNDELTFKYAGRDDLWLHARDVPGSHVLIRRPGSKEVPMPVIEYAAGLAAAFSKRKHDSLVPVMYALRRHLRKPRGGAPGQVLVEHEKTVYVAPHEHAERD